MKSAPDIIFLQWHTEECSDDCLQEVTWCEDRIEDSDIEYVRKGKTQNREKYWQEKAGRMATIANCMYQHLDEKLLSEDEQDEISNMFKEIMEVIDFDEAWGDM